MIEQKIREYLDATHLGWVILDSLPAPKLVSLLGRLNIEYKGIRMSSLPPQELAYGLADEAFLHPEIMGLLIKPLDEANSQELDWMARLSEEKLKALIDSSRKTSLLPEKIGKIIWALLRDQRPQINKLLPEFLEVVTEILDRDKQVTSQIENDADKMGSALSSKKGLKKLRQAMLRFEEELAQERRFSAQVSKESERLSEKNAEFQRSLQELRRSSGELAHEKGLLAKQIIKKDSELANLQQQVRELKDKLIVGPKFRLKSELHHLEKENSKLNWTLEKERQGYAAMKEEWEKEVFLLKEKIRQLEEENSKGLKELENQRQSHSSLQREYQLLSVKMEPPLAPKEKGNRLGIFIDNQNVYYSAKMHYGRKIDYQKLLELIVRDRHLVKAVCYIVQKPEVSQEKFINILKGYGYTVRTRDLIQRADGSAKGNWDIGIAVDVITMVEKNNLDIVSLVTCDGDFVDLIKLLLANRMRVEVVGFPMNTAMDLKKTADEYYYITEELMVSQG